MKDFEYWSTSKGVKIKISDMDTTHIINSINKIKNSPNNWRSEWLPYLEEELKLRNWYVNSSNINDIGVTLEEEIYFLNTSCGYTYIGKDKVLSSISSDIKNKLPKYIIDFLESFQGFSIDEEKIKEGAFLKKLSKDLLNINEKDLETSFFKKYAKFQIQNVFTSEWKLFIDLMLGRR